MAVSKTAGGLYQSENKAEDGTETISAVFLSVPTGSRVVESCHSVPR